MRAVELSSILVLGAVVLAQEKEDRTLLTIEDFPTGQTWQPVVGELWMTTPRPEKIYDLHDIPESVASTNANVDITGELVSIGQGTAEDFQGRDVKGKFVLSL